MVARLVDSQQVVQGGATNMSSLAPFGGRRLFLGKSVMTVFFSSSFDRYLMFMYMFAYPDVSHDNTMVSILSALGIPRVRDCLFGTEFLFY